MKPTRIFRIALCMTLFALLLTTEVELAEELNLSRMSDDEIVSFYEPGDGRNGQQWYSKDGPTPAGYLAGTDLPSSRFVYTCLAKGDV